MKLNREKVLKIVEAAFSTRPEEIGCDDCFTLVGEFAERTLDLREVPDALRLVGEHLQRCPDCREEFEALLAALRGFEESG